MKILIIEDEYNLADAIRSSLKKEKYKVNIETDGLNGLNEALTNLYDLIVLDVMLPHKNGIEILKEIKKENIESKIIMLTAASSIEDKLTGFNNGADDYLTKPFHMDELLARINIQLRKTNISNNIIEYGDLKLDINKMVMYSSCSNNEVQIIGKEFELLELFINNNNQILNKELIFEKIWGYDSESDINSLEAYLSFIRKKIKLLNSNVNIKSVRGIGYKLEVKNEKTEN